MKKNILTIITAIFGILCVLGCSKGTAYTYDVKNISHPDWFYITKTVYYDDRVKISFKGGSDFTNFSTSDDSKATIDAGNSTITVYSDNPTAITSLDVYSGEYEVRFRQLNTSAYVCIWRTGATDLGWSDYKGDVNHYYTAEEREKQREKSKVAEQNIIEREETDKELFDFFEGRWVSDNMDYFDIYEYESGKGLLYFDADSCMYQECHDLFFSKSGSDENLCEISEPGSGWGSYASFAVKISDDKKSFRYEGRDYYYKDDEIWEGVEVNYIRPIEILLENSKEWELSDEMLWDASEKDTIEGVAYAITDLDGDGYPEVIKSGHRGSEGYGYSIIYEVQNDGSIKKINSNSLSDPNFYELPPNLYAINTCKRLETMEGYKYLVDGNCNLEGNGSKKQYYLMSFRYDMAVLERICAKEVLGDENGRTENYYDDKQNTISGADYEKILNNQDKASKTTVRFGWFSEITEENMAESIRKFQAVIEEE
ncbi:MAG: hypothetical protein J5856_02305 [Lachnospiraceae bacterium]|nr:hypothetical protein [Lachnospiraceae bacterium]